MPPRIPPPPSPPPLAVLVGASLLLAGGGGDGAASASASASASAAAFSLPPPLALASVRSRIRFGRGGTGGGRGADPHPPGSSRPIGAELFDAEYVPSGLTREEYAALRERERREASKMDYGGWGPRFLKGDRPDGDWMVVPSLWTGGFDSNSNAGGSVPGLGLGLGPGIRLPPEAGGHRGRPGLRPGAGRGGGPGPGALAGQVPGGPGGRGRRGAPAPDPAPSLPTPPPPSPLPPRPPPRRGGMARPSLRGPSLRGPSLRGPPPPPLRGGGVDGRPGQPQVALESEEGQACHGAGTPRGRGGVRAAALGGDGPGGSCWAVAGRGQRGSWAPD